MADDVPDGHDVPQDRPEPVVMRTYAKPPKEYKFGTDFRTYLARFILYCNLNRIPEQQRGPLLFTLLDSHSFNIANNLQIHNMRDFEQVVEQLTQKFDSPAGELGNQIRLNNRKQLLNESLTDYLDTLIQMGQLTAMDNNTQHEKVMETMLEHCSDPDVKQKILKVISRAQDEHWDPDRKWENFLDKIKFLEKMKALGNYAKTAPLPSEIGNDWEDKINQLSEKIQNLTVVRNNSQNKGKQMNPQHNRSLNPPAKEYNNQNFRNFPTNNNWRNNNRPYRTFNSRFQRPNYFSPRSSYTNYQSPNFRYQRNYTPRINNFNTNYRQSTLNPYFNNYRSFNKPSF